MTDPTTVHRRLARLAPLALALLAIGSAACGDDARMEESAAPTHATPAPVAAERPTAEVDELVTIGGGRLHIRCRGAGPTTVVLVAGWGAGADGWVAVEPAVAESARVCAYERFGTGTSDPASRTQTFATQAADLHELLREAGEPGPYVLAGHSFGGAEAVTFAARYADEVAGLLLIDASPPTWPATVCSVPSYGELCAVMRDPDRDPERLDTFAAFDAVADIDSLGALPTTVLTAAHRTDPTLGDDELARLDALWAEGVDRWAALSASSTVVTVEGTGHHIEVDRPDIVVDEILALLG